MPTLYPTSVIDNVDASTEFLGSDYAPGTPVPHPPTCETSASWAAKAPDYQTPPMITMTRARIAATTTVQGATAATATALAEPKYMIGAWTM